MKAPLDLSALDPRAASAVERAIALGWQARGYQSRRSPAGVLLIAPAPHRRKQIVVPPVRQWNRAKLAALLKTIERYGVAARATPTARTRITRAS